MSRDCENGHRIHEDEPCIDCGKTWEEIKSEELKSQVATLTHERNEARAVLEFLCRDGYPHHPTKEAWTANGEAINKALCGKGDLLAQAREAAIEEAIEACVEVNSEIPYVEAVGAKKCEERIRALKGKPA